MRLVVGLGNPGRKYHYNRHNLGFLVIDQLTKEFNLAQIKTKTDCIVYHGTIANEEILLLKPQNYMNNSGTSIAQHLKHYRVELYHLVVIHDDIDLTPGVVKLKIGGGAGGHNGLRSIDALLGKEYHRIRLGVGHPGHRDMVSDYVLTDLIGEERISFTNLVERIALNFPLYIKGEQTTFLSNVNR